MLLHGIDTNKVNILQILVGVTSLVDGDAKILGVSFPSLLAYESGKAVADAVFSSYQSWQCDTVVSRMCFDTHTTPSNPGRTSGVCTLLENAVGRILLWMARWRQM